MNTEITENQIADYQENGFLIYDEFLNKKEIMDLKKAINNAISEMGEIKLPAEQNLKNSKIKKGIITMKQFTYKG